MRSRYPRYTKDTHSKWTGMSFASLQWDYRFDKKSSDTLNGGGIPRLDWVSTDWNYVPYQNSVGVIIGELTRQFPELFCGWGLTTPS